MRPARRALAAALIVSMLAPAGSALAADASLERTNIEMAEEAIRGAIREALETFPPATADLRLIPLGNSDANPLVEGVLVEELAARGYPVEIATPREVQAVLGETLAEPNAGGGAAGPAAGDAAPGGPDSGNPAGPADSSTLEGGAAPADPGAMEGAATDAGDTTDSATTVDGERPKPAGLAAQIRAMRDAEAASGAVGEPAPASTPVSPVVDPLSEAEVDLLANRATFSYRVTDFDFRYADIYRKMFVGPKRIRRLAQVELHMRLTEEGGRRVTWSRNVQHSTSDVITYDAAAHLESTAFAFAKPERAPSFLTRLYEPLVVGAIVGGLVFLFYSNQSGD
jgi:hypothetical protein